MNAEEARALILRESTEGIAYSSRWGKYPDRAHFSQIIEAIQILHRNNRGQKQVDRELVAALFVIGDQVQGNLDGAISKNIEIPAWFQEEGIVELTSALYAIFEDHDELE